ncbi:conjugal transfer protein TraM [Mucilaginibacter hurinus]|uniref:Conjugal transfer protein TraM n=1 Tax=Mucilaginibacter hurinus TaxID=2201324 RepID=A0A367GTY3_9SPHI|nr:conjugative transposon protein TraM [Mucilaginibacter hurinus]RCH56839.1 conjugal transfer protein TraM [Mucilaginibacter hurinus]
METTNEMNGQVPLNPELQKKRKFYLVVPLLVLPFLTLAFWALGGGSAKNDDRQDLQPNGINMALPSAQFKGKEETDKLNIYQTAAKDSARIDDGVSKDFIETMGFDPRKADHSASAETPQFNNEADLGSARITAKLAEINRQVSRPGPDPETEESSAQVKKLNRMVKAMNSPSARDPEMEQLNAMLTKIQAIQNPELAYKQPAKRTDNTPFQAVPAVIDGKQKVVDGGTVRLKLTDSVVLRGYQLPKGQLLYGACQVTNQRLLLTIQNIRLDQQIIPVSLTVFSLDGMPGIPAPEADLGTVAGNGADNAIQSMQIMSMDASIGAQAAAGGINAAKGLFSKKVRKIKVKLKNEYPVLLKINKS